MSQKTNRAQTHQVCLKDIIAQSLKRCSANWRRNAWEDHGRTYSQLFDNVRFSHNTYVTLHSAPLKWN